MDEAPYRADLADGPDEARAVWVRASDDVQLRVGIWPNARARDTVLIFPGRTEYIEKYGRVARELIRAGYAAAAIDWRGQGFSDRLADDRLLGHVLHFTDYQKDVAAFLSAVEGADMPPGRFLVAHSMGGAIGLRALTQRLTVERAVFSAPMWGIQIPTSRKALAAMLPTLARMAGQGLRYTPGSRPVIYDSDLGFYDNPLTTDPDHFEWFARQLQMEEAFFLAGPSLHWLGEALSECRALGSLVRPRLPVLTFLGTEETVVSQQAIERMHKTWDTATLRMVDGARHEVLMEKPQIRRPVLDQALAFLGGAVA